MGARASATSRACTDLKCVCVPSSQPPFSGCCDDQLNPPSIRSFLTGLRKKGVNLEREQRRDGATGYRIVKLDEVDMIVERTTIDG